MRLFYHKGGWWAIIWMTVMAGCSEKLSYNEVVAEELSRDVQVDSLFHGVYFNMSMKSFYDHCFEMNQRGIFFQNKMNIEVIVKYEEKFSMPVDFVFFPDGSYPTIQKVKGYMKFRRWAPFINKYSAGILQEELKEKIEDEYGGRDFIKIEHPDNHWPYAYVKIDGNRKILLYRSFDDQRVEVIFENLSAYGQDLVNKRQN